jgi:hypothetical protein
MTKITKSSSFDKHLDEFKEHRDIYQEMLQHKRLPQTRRAYTSDIKDFFGFFFDLEPNPIAIQDF